MSSTSASAIMETAKRGCATVTTERVVSEAGAEKASAEARNASMATARYSMVECEEVGCEIIQDPGTPWYRGGFFVNPCRLSRATRGVVAERGRGRRAWEHIKETLQSVLQRGGQNHAGCSAPKKKLEVKKLS